MCLLFLGRGLSIGPGALHLLQRVGIGAARDLDEVALQCPFPGATGEFLRAAVWKRDSGTCP